MVNPIATLRSVVQFDKFETDPVERRLAHPPSGQSVRPLAETRLDVDGERDQSSGVPENHFDEWVAQNYKVLWAHLFEPEVVEPAVEYLAGLAGDGPIVEFGIGTGRLALPLSRRGIHVDGIELSAAMVEQLHAEPGSSNINVTIGDFSTTNVDGTYTLAYLVRNTIMNLTTQDAQVECFLNAARHLVPGGFFVIEVIVHHGKDPRRARPSSPST